MSFKQAVELEKLKEIARSIMESIEVIEEYGHVAIPTSEYPNLKVRTEELQEKMKECDAILDKFCDEQTEWFSY